MSGPGTTPLFVDTGAFFAHFVDHTTGVLADEVDAEHIFTFDSGFRTLGFSLVPDDINHRDK